MFLPNPIGGLVSVFGAKSGMAAEYCVYTNSGSGAALNEYTSTPEGDAAVDICDACGIGMGVIVYYDGNGNRRFHYDCVTLRGEEQTLYYKTVKKTFEIPGCSTTFTYTDCVKKPQQNLDYCDNDFYWDDDHNCAACPLPSLDITYYEENRPNDKWILAQSGLGGATCGYGTRESDSEGVESCVIAADSDCYYCDTTGCFQLTKDCPYTP